MDQINNGTVIEGKLAEKMASSFAKPISAKTVPAKQERL